MILLKDLLKIEQCLDNFITKNKIDANQVDTLFLTGGTSLVRAIQNLFFRKFPLAKIESGVTLVSLKVWHIVIIFLIIIPQLIDCISDLQYYFVNLINVSLIKHIKVFQCRFRVSMPKLFWNLQGGHICSFRVLA